MSYDLRVTQDRAGAVGWAPTPTPLRRIPAPRQIASAIPLGHDFLSAPLPATVQRGSALPPEAASLPEGFPALAPLAGRIAETRMVRLIGGRGAMAVEIEVVESSHPAADESPVPAAPLPEIRRLLAQIDPSSDRARWIDRLRDLGVWCDRIDSPDLLGQLRRAAGAGAAGGITRIVAHALDPDPPLRLNATVAATEPAQTLAGIGLLGRLFDCPMMLLIEAGAPAAWVDPLRAMARVLQIRLLPVAGGYPRSQPSLLLRAALRRRLPVGACPTRAGAIVVDACAAAAIGAAAIHARPLLEVPVGILDHERRRTLLLRAPIGTSVDQLLAAADIFPPPPSSAAPGAAGPPVRMGSRGQGGAGAMLRCAAVLREIPVGPDDLLAGTENTLHVMPAAVPTNPDPCIRCGWCIEGCPTGIDPAGILEAAQRRDDHLARRYGIDACIECGVCTYVCPSRLPLARAARIMRSGERPGKEIE